MNRYMVLTYYAEEEQLVWDTVLAETPEAAQEFVVDTRGSGVFALGGEPMTAEELFSMGKNLDERTENEIRLQMRDLRRNCRSDDETVAPDGS